MEASTLIAPEPGTTRRTRAQPPPSAPPRLPRRALELALPAILLLALVLRLWGVKQGLPFVYNIDEAQHFVPKAIGFFGHNWNPEYFLNPPGYSELLHVVFAVWFGGRDGVAHAYATNPTEVFVVARVTAAVLGVAAVWFVYLAGRRLFDRPAALLAAAVSAVAFLPVFYSHLAVNDVPTLAPLTLSLYGAARVLERGRRRDYALTGLAGGLAAGFKYTGGIVLLCVLGGVLVHATAYRGYERLRRDARRRALGGVAFALLCALVGFLIANPYALLDFPAFREGITSQAALASGEDISKLGLTQSSGILYYLWAFTWGFGWAPSGAALAGAGLLAARRHRAAIVLLPAIPVFLVIMGTQQRYFGRWLLPLFPFVALLAGYAVAEAIRAAVRLRPQRAALIAVPAVAALLAQGLVTTIHDDAVLARADTRNLARDWMVRNIPTGAKVVIEPIVPDLWGQDIGSPVAGTELGERWHRFPVTVSDVDDNARPLPHGQKRFVLIDKYERTLRPQLIDEYIAGDYCWVVIGSTQYGRAFAQPREVPQAIAYYDALARRGTQMFRSSPYGPGDGGVRFNFDWSIDYYPLAYHRPGPAVSVYRLHGGACG